LSVSCGHKKTGPKAGFFVPEPDITWQQERLQREQRERLQREQLQREQLQQREPQQRERLPSEQQLQQQELQQQELRQEQQLLLFGRKRSWKQPAGQPGGRNISFDFPLLTI
jgi:hypothetical protein